MTAEVSRYCEVPFIFLVTYSNSSRTRNLALHLKLKWIFQEKACWWHFFLLWKMFCWCVGFAC